MSVSPHTSPGQTNKSFLNYDTVDAFCAQNHVDRKTAEAAGIQWSTLEAICKHHAARADELRTAGIVVTTALQPVPYVHSLKMRVKNWVHLAEKIIRKRIDDPKNVIDETNYTEQITDLVGVRALHLFKEDCFSIHEAIKERWEFHEQPKAYVRKGDSDEYQLEFTKAGFLVNEHPHGYRSLHYLAKCQPQKTLIFVELQVRTIFEEGWSEIDHRVRYPSFSDSPLLKQFLNMFNRLAGSADEMGSFVVLLNAQLISNAAKTEELEVQLGHKGKQIEEVIEKLNISESEKKGLKEQLAELRAARTKESQLSMDIGSQPTFGQLSNSLLGQSVNIKDLLSSLGGSQSYLDNLKCSSCGKIDVGLIGGKCLTCSVKGFT